MRRRNLALGAILTMALVVGRAAAPAAERAPPSEAEGRAAFQEAAKVLLHPRCVNCHPRGDAPLQGDDGHRHAQNVSRRSSRVGLRCTSCHREANSHLRGGPPGVPSWHMPPDEHPMPFEGHTAATLCAQLKDPAQNGGRRLAGVIEHLDADPLVLWAWAPGDGRSVPPIGHAAFVAAMRRWVEAGGPCP